MFGQRICRLLAGTALTLLGCAGAYASTSRPNAGPPSQAVVYSLPMQFEPNTGQTREDFRFLSRGPGYSLALARDEVHLYLRGGSSRKASKQPFRDHKGLSLQEGIGAKVNQTTLGISLVNGNPDPVLEGLQELPASINYFVGNNPENWHVGIHPFSKVKYHDVYPGTDLVFYGNQRQLEYDFLLEPGAQPARICLEFHGSQGLSLDGEGGLVIRVEGGQLHWAKPVAFQDQQGARKEITCRFVLRGEHQVGFEVGSYDTRQPLVIDPLLVYSTYLGGSDFDTGEAIAVDNSGNVYIAGDTASVNFPHVNSFDATPNGSNDVFVAKLNATGTALIYSTYLGGSGDDFAHGIAIDASGNAYVTGSTESPNFPLMNAYQNTYQGGGGDVFVTKLNAAGNAILYSTLLGGTDYESGNAVAVDNSGNAYVAGETDSLISSGPTHPVPFPTVNTFQRNPGGGFADAFVAKINTTLSGSASLIYSSFLGGTTDEKANAIAIDGSGNAYVVGQVFDSTSIYPNPATSDFPTLNAFQSQFNAGSTDPAAGSVDGFITKINSAGSAMVFSTFLGGFGDDECTDIVLDSAGRIYVTGETGSTNFPTLNATQPIIGGGNIDFPLADAFITVFQSDGRTLVYSTFLGGSLDELAPALAVDQFGEIYITGETLSYDFPLITNALQTNAWGTSDGFVAKINPAVPGPSSLIYSTLFGGGDDFGNGDNAGAGIVVDTNGNYYVVGRTSAATNFPVTSGVLSTTNVGSEDAFIAKFSTQPDLSVAMIPSVEPVVVGSNLTFTIYINNNGRSTFTGVTNQVAIAPVFQILSVSTSAGNWSTNNGVLIFNLGTVTANASITQTIVVKTLTQGLTTNTATLSSIETGLGLEPNTDNNLEVVLSTVQGIADVKLTSMTEAPNPTVVTSNLTYTFQIDNKGPYTATSVVLTDPLPPNLSVVSSTNSVGAYWSTNTGEFVLSLGSLPSGTGASVTIVAQATAPGSVINSATVSGFELDTNPGNNSGTTVTTVNPLSDLSLKLSASANSVFASSNLTYTLVVTNKGPSPGTGVTLTDSLPSTATVVSVVPTQGTWAQTNNVVTCSLGSMTTGGVATVTIVVRFLQGGSFTNLATVSSSAPDPNPGDNSAGVTTTVIPLADLLVSQGVAPNPGMVGSNLTYTILVTNRGPSMATGTTLTDPIPAGLAFVSAQSTIGTCSLANGVLTCSIGNLASGGAAVVTLKVEATLDGTIVNTATATSSVTDPNNNNTSSMSVTVNPNTNAPVLRIWSSGPNIVLSWTTNAVGFVLQSEPALGTNLWTTVTNIPVRVGNQFMVTNAATADSTFYRLWIPPPPPNLSALEVGTNVVVSWPASATGYLLQAKPTLATASVWTPVTNPPVSIGNRFYVTNPSSGFSRFYRLAK